MNTHTDNPARFDALPGSEMNQAIASVITKSGLFDSQWYLEKYQDVKILGIDPLEHYIWIGAAMGRLPSRAFTLADLPGTGVWDERRGQNPLYSFIMKHNIFMDPEYYLVKNRDVQRAGFDPERHYLKYGRYEKRFPNRFSELAGRLDAEWYKAKHLGDSDQSPLFHYINEGVKQKLKPAESLIAYNPHRRYTEPEYGGVDEPYLMFDAPCEIPEGFNFSVGVHIHVFYRELFDELAMYISNIPVPYTAYVTIPEGHIDLGDMERQALNRLIGAKEVIVRAVPNRGRDIAPFIAGVGKDALNHDLMLHVHTKRSPHNPGHAGWRRYLMHYLCGNASVVSQIFSSFHHDPNLAAFFPPYFPSVRNQPSWGTNFEKTKSVGRLIGCDIMPEKCPDYPAGSFFWMRVNDYRRLFDGSLSLEDFEEEAGQVDNTTAHAIERLFGVIPFSSGKTVAMRYIDIAHNLIDYYHSNRDLPSQQDRTDDVKSYLAAKSSRTHRAKIAVATAITGGFDPLLLPDILEADVDYVCFSDQDIDGYGVFEIRKLDYTNKDKRRIARYAKTHLISLLPGYDYIFWIDANIQLRCGVGRFIEGLKSAGKSVGGIHHPVRLSCFEEGKAAIEQKLDDAELIAAQLSRYSAIPNLGGARLVETNFMIFDSTNSKTKTFTDLWWSEIESNSRRDQLSVNYALMQAGIDLYPLFEENMCTRDSGCFYLYDHGLAPTPIVNQRFVHTLPAIAASHDSVPSDAATLKRFTSVQDLLTSSEDGEVIFDVVRSGPVNQGAVANDIDGTSKQSLPNGVSLSNWLPSVWSKEEWFASVGLSRLHNALCFGGLIDKTFPDGHESGQLLLTQDRKLVEASFGVWNGERLLPRNLLSKDSDGRLKLNCNPSQARLAGDYFLIGNVQPHFGHAILEGLSRLWPMYRSVPLPADVKFLVYEPFLRDVQKELLSRAGVDLSRVVHVPKDGVTVERLWVADASIRSHRWVSDLQGDVWRAVSSTAFDGKPTRLTYLSRSRIAERPLMNEAHVEAIFEKNGFDVVHPQELSLGEQLRLAAESRIIAGPVGSQMYLAAFQKSNTSKIVLAPKNFYAKDDQMISSVVCGSCDVIFGSEIDNFADRKDRQWTIDTEQVARGLAAVL
ncbi:rhamnan synthesis F family protein [Agrobacterium sp. FDAARGOS_525]|uniref:rhamnan synthesis F family protein n=1 Tax=Agrobacterium sp. FDAARGOS_525 TaxID=2420311 RepID=UPI001562E7A3|nr:rhamnan synthesis F family protein [Agrobacterium sp. FDAARGOS_525]